MNLKDWFNELPKQFKDELDFEVEVGKIGLVLKNEKKIILHSATYKKNKDEVTLTNR